jgi:hypothetical protein
MAISIDLKYVTYSIDVENKIVSTHFKTEDVNLNYVAHATRDWEDYQNQKEAHSQGYSGPDAVWQSLVHHELLHSLVSEVLWDSRSRVLATESGLEFIPSWLRYEEESLVLAFQCAFNSDFTLPVGNIFVPYRIDDIVTTTERWKRLVPLIGF